MQQKEIMARMKLVKKLFAIAFIFAIGVLTSGAVSPHIERGQIAITAFPVIHKKGHALAYDGRTKIPLWVYEEISSQDVLGKIDRTECGFMEDPEVYPLHKSTLEDYKKSGYDRGRRVRAALEQTALLSEPSVPISSTGLFNNGFTTAPIAQAVCRTL